jgi:serine protease Do
MEGLRPLKAGWIGGALVALALVAGIGAACSDDNAGDRTSTAPPAGTATTQRLSNTGETPSPAATDEPEAQEEDEDRAAEDDPEVSDLLSVADIAEQARPSVVRVTTEAGTGSGWVLDSDGHIVTNNHVISVPGFAGQAEATNIVVTTDDGRELPAQVVGSDLRTDLAILRVDASDLEPLPLADLDEVRIGDPVVAIGFALDLGESPSVTTGVISAKERVIQEQTGILGALQTDAAINPGNSGGPLLNLRGEVVGVNTAIDPGAQGIGFAISVETVEVISSELIENGQVVRGFVGIQGFEDVTPAMAEQFDLPVDSGVRLDVIVPGSPADIAGLQSGDVLVEVAGRTIEVSSDVPLAVVGHAPGETIDIELYRGSEKLTLPLTLGEPV